MPNSDPPNSGTSSTAPRRYAARTRRFDLIACPAVRAKLCGLPSGVWIVAALDWLRAVCEARFALAKLVLRVLLVLAPVLAPLAPLAAAPIAVRFAEGVSHGFLLLRTADGGLIASGDLLQVSRGAKVESRMVFRFKDGSLLDETVVFTQQRVFAMQSYHLVQRGPAFAEDSDISLQGTTGKYNIKTKSHKDGAEESIDGKLELPADVYNGMVLTVVKNLPKGASASVHMVAFTPKPLLIELELALAGEHKVMVDQLTKNASHYLFKPHPGPWLEIFAKLLNRMPSDYHAWVVTEDVPAFVKFEGPLNPTGPIWQIELTSPRWSE